MSGEIGNVILDALGAFSPANVRARFGELAEALSPFLEILFYVVSYYPCHLGSHHFLK